VGDMSYTVKPGHIVVSIKQSHLLICPFILLFHKNDHTFLFPFHIKIKCTYVVDRGTSSILFGGGVSDNITDCFTLDYSW
jgi:hypothetical protein